MTFSLKKKKTLRTLFTNIMVYALGNVMSTLIKHFLKTCYKQMSLNLLKITAVKWNQIYNKITKLGEFQLEMNIVFLIATCTQLLQVTTKYYSISNQSGIPIKGENFFQSILTSL